MALVAVNAAVTLGLWFRHGDLHALTGPGGIATAAGQLTALAGTYAVLVQLLLMARVPWLERQVGLDRLAVWHRWNGFAAVWLLLRAHGAHHDRLRAEQPRVAGRARPVTSSRTIPTC